jgi:basic membrane protein A
MNIKLIAAVMIVVVVIAAAYWYLTLPPPPLEEFKIGIAFDVGGRGDKSFCDMAYFGAQRAKADFSDQLNISITTITPLSLAEMEDVLRTMSTGGEYDIIIAVGFLFTDALNITSAEFPDQLYAGIDIFLPGKDNVLGVVYEEEQGCALVGALAALLTESGDVGNVLGMEIPILWKFEIGYKFGVDYVRNVTGKSVNVTWDYTGFFDRPDLGRESAITMLDAGVDVIFIAAGETGLGAIDAVGERGNVNELPLGIGVDANQDWIYPGKFIASMRKLVDVGSYTAIEMVIEDTFEGGILSLGIPEGGIGVSDLDDLDEWLNDPVLQPIIEWETGMTAAEVRAAFVNLRGNWTTVDGYDVWAIVGELEQKILDGELVVPVPTSDNIAYYRTRY